MRLDQISARIAPRGAWQAMDLGVRLYQHWALPLTLIYVLVSLVPLLLFLWFGGEHNWAWALLAFWWLKPLWERPLLEYCAQALFSQAPTIKSLLREFYQHSLRGLLPWLLLRRLDPARSFHLPVTQLEKQKGTQFSQRTRVLGMGQNDQSGSLTFILLGIEMLVTAGLIALVAMMIPSQYYLQEFSWLLEQDKLLLWVGIGCYYLATCLIAPLYVCCGFALYLNKRTWLEGWDLELGLRRIGQRRGKILQRLSLSVLLCAALITLPWSSQSAFAEQSHTGDDTAEVELVDPKQQAIDILAGSEFTPVEIKDSWRFKDFSNASNDDEEINEENIEFWKRLFKWLASWFDGKNSTDDDDVGSGFEWPTLAEIFRFVLWVIAVSVAIWLVTRLIGLRPPARAVQTRASKATHVAGLDIRPESLPDDIRGAALQALDNGDVRLALSLLYRASLSHLLAQLDCPLDAGSTENECLRALRSNSNANTDQITYLTQLTRAWISTAWAHRPSQQQEVTALADQWPALFGTAQESADAA